MPTHRAWWNPFGRDVVIDLTEEASAESTRVIDVRTDSGRTVCVTPSALEAYRTLKRHAELEQVDGYPVHEDEAVTSARRLLLSH